MRRLPIRHDKPFEVPVFLQDVGQQILVFARVVSIHTVVSAHDRGWIPLAHANLERQQIAFSHRTLIDVGVDGIAPTLLIVHRVMLDVANDVLSLRSPNQRSDHSPGEDWVLAQVLKRAAIARLASQIHASAEGHIVALRSQFATDQRSILIGCIQVPTRGCGQIGGQGGGVAAILPALPHSVGGVGHLNRGYPQTWNAHHIARPAVRTYRQRTDRA